MYINIVQFSFKELDTLLLTDTNDKLLEQALFAQMEPKL